MVHTIDKSKTAEEVQWENRIAFQKSEHDRLVKAKDMMQAEIDKKTVDYNVYLAQKDTDSKKSRQEVQDQTEQLLKDKQEFQAILQSFQMEKSAYLAEKSNTSKELAKANQKMDDIKGFIAAVQRAMTLLDFR